MRKRLLPVFLTLCMILAQTPAAFAASTSAEQPQVSGADRSVTSQESGASAVTSDKTDGSAVVNSDEANSDPVVTRDKSDGSDSAGSDNKPDSSAVVTSQQADSSKSANNGKSDNEPIVGSVQKGQNDEGFPPSNADPAAVITANGGQKSDVTEWSNTNLNLSGESNVTITLKKDVTGSIEIPKGAVVTLDLNGFTLTNTANKHTITNTGTLTIKDGSGSNPSGTVDNVSNAHAALVNQTDGIVTLESGTLTRSKESAKESNVNQKSADNHYYVVDNDGTMQVNGGTIKNTSYTSSLMRLRGSLTVTDGHMENDFITLKVDEGTVDGVYKVGKAVIKGGTIISHSDQAVANWGSAAISGNPTITGNVVTWGYGDETHPVGGNTVISSGTITGNVTAAIGGGPALLKNQKKIPTVTISDSTVVNGDVYYGLYKDAVKSDIHGMITIQNGSVGNVRNDSDHGDIIVSGGTVRKGVENQSTGTIGISGGTVTGDVSNSGAGSVEIKGGIAKGNVSDTGSGTVKISNGTVNGIVTNGGVGSVSVSGGTVGGTVANAGTGSVAVSGGIIGGAVSNTGTGSVTVSGGTVNGAVTNTGGGTIAVSGGTFAVADVSSFIPSGHILITFDGNGGVCNMKSAALALSGGQASLASLPTPSKTGSYTFSGWYTASGAKVDKDTPLKESQTLYAHWTYTGGGSSGGGGGSHSGGGGGGGGSSSESTSSSAKPVIAETSVTTNVSQDGHATTTVTDQTISDAVKEAKAQADKNGTAVGDITAVIKVDTGSKDASSVSVSLSKAMQEQVESDKVGKVAIQLSKQDITLGMDLNTIKSMNDQANADVQLSVTCMDTSSLSKEAKDVIGGRPTFDLKATYNDGKNSITSFGTGTVSVEIPYTLQQGEVAGNVCAVYVDDNGKVNYLSSSSYDSKAKAVRFTTNHFSVYGVGYKENTPSVNFTDIADHWARQDIEFVAGKGLMSGTGNGMFTPDGAMTRGMFVTTLGRLAKVDGASYTNGKFSDVSADAYYAPYVNWAAENGIVSGTSATTFSPDQSVTRQEMAVMMSNYAKAMGNKLPQTHQATTFTDASSIADWATDAVQQMQMAGIISGREDNSFDPTGTATRGEVASLLHRFVEAIAE